MAQQLTLIINTFNDWGEAALAALSSEFTALFGADGAIESAYVLSTLERRVVIAPTETLYAINDDLTSLAGRFGFIEDEDLDELTGCVASKMAGQSRPWVTEIDGPLAVEEACAICGTPTAAVGGEVHHIDRQSPSGYAEVLEAAHQAEVPA